jgi:dihydroorotate dehydrogenase electron transfer subunit
MSRPENNEGSHLIQQKARILSNEAVVPDTFLMEIHSPELIALGQPGQFLHLRVGRKDDFLLRRPLSLFSRGEERSAIGLLYRIVGQGTRLLSRMVPGQGLDLVGPLGRSFSVPGGTDTAILVAGGLGVAPLFFLAQDLVRRGMPVHFLLGARSRQQLLCEDRLQALGVHLAVSTDDGSKGFPGLVTGLLEDVLGRGDLAGRSPCLYVTGPEPMMKAVAGQAHGRRLPAQFSLERHMACGVGACLGCVLRGRTERGDPVYRRVCLDGPVFHLEELPWC